MIKGAKNSIGHVFATCTFEANRDRAEGEGVSL